MNPHVIDANAIHVFQQERIQGAPGRGHARISAIIESDCIALDEEGLCYQEWLDCAGGSVPFALADWVADLAIYGQVRRYSLADNKCRTKLLSVGLPAPDHKWVRLAVGSGSKILITNDIDFFDPTKKRADEKTKRKIREAGTGPCAKLIYRNFGVTVEIL